MLFDLEPYVPFEIYVVCCVILLVVIASKYDVSKGEEDE